MRGVSVAGSSERGPAKLALTGGSGGSETSGPSGAESEKADRASRAHCLRAGCKKQWKIMLLFGYERSKSPLVFINI